MLCLFPTLECTTTFDSPVHTHRCPNSFLPSTFVPLLSDNLQTRLILQDRSEPLLHLADVTQGMKSQHGAWPGRRFLGQQLLFLTRQPSSHGTWTWGRAGRAVLGGPKGQKWDPPGTDLGSPNKSFSDVRSCWDGMGRGSERPVHSETMKGLREHGVWDCRTCVRVLTLLFMGASTSPPAKWEE